MQKPNSVEEYIAKAPEEIQDKLRELRKIIQDTVPEAQEKLSYSMPYYGYKGRLAYFAFAKKHIGLYLPPPVIEEHKEELKSYVTAMATVQFPHEKPLPKSLIVKLLRARVAKNEEKK